MTKETYLQSLYRKHRALDDEIKILYTKFADDQLINRLKTQKLWLKGRVKLQKLKFIIKSVLYIVNVRISIGIIYLYRSRKYNIS